MTRRRFFAPPSAFHQNTVRLASDEAKHLREALRLKPGDEVFVFDGAGNEFRCSITQAKRDEATLEIIEAVPSPAPESPINITLAVALLKGEKFDQVVQKATELGVTEIIPVMTRHADIHLRDASDAEKRVMRWRRIALEAAKQCGRAKTPEVFEPQSLGTVLEADVDSLRLLFSERGGESINSIKETNPSTIAALVGSEGGWSDDEIDGAKLQGWKIVTLGGRILRAETAGIAVMALLQNHYGDLR